MKGQQYYSELGKEKEAQRISVILKRRYLDLRKTANSEASIRIDELSNIFKLITKKSLKEEVKKGFWRRKK